ncbi:MAG: sigma-70 family RNA polymerase sigma factor [Burkholderiales bacterium]|nr:sigma-70 family RNA polymerase sigma factor [Burkholderiales bacterium]
MGIWGSRGVKTRDLSGEALERDLLAQIAIADRNAFERLYRIYFDRLARFLDKMTRNSSLIEEVINDTMMVVWNKAQTFNGSSKVSTWIFAIAYRQALKALNAYEEPLEAEHDERQSEAHFEPDFQLYAKQIDQEFGRALLALSVEQRTVVSLTYYHDMGYQEIADTMDCPVNTVKTRMFHARQRLKTLLLGSIGAQG